MKKKLFSQLFLLFVAVAALLFAVGCNCDKSKLYNTWVLEKYGPENALKTVITSNPPVTEILLILTDTSKFNGNDGCNLISGTYTTADWCKIKFENIISTNMYCNQDGIMEQASAITALIRSANKFEVTDTQLKLCTPTHEILQYRKK